MSQVAGAAAGGPGQRNLWVYLAFVLFGAGSAWIVVSAVFLELAAYEDELGLLAPNRCSLGYQAGALMTPLFAAVRRLLQHCGQEVNYRALIVAMAALNLLALAMAATGLHSLESLMLVAFLAGSCGYLSGVVHQAYLVVNCEDVYSAAFWAGDATAGALAAVLAAIQRPELGRDGRRFSPAALYCMMMPVVLVALAVFSLIDCKAFGFLPEKAALKRPAAGTLLPADASFAMSEVPSTADATQAPPAAAAKQPAAPPRPEAVGRMLVEADRERAPLRGAAQAKVAEEDHGPVQAELEVEPQLTVVRALQPLELEDGEAKAPPAGGADFLAWLPPRGAAARPGYTAALTAISFWMSFTCWGVGDSVIPYACERSSMADQGKECLFQSSLATVAAILVGSNLAGIASVPSASHLVAPGVIYTVAFGLLCLAAVWGGRWASPLAGPAAGIRASQEATGGGYILTLVLVMRTLQPFVQVTRQRLIQTAYKPEDREDMNLFFYAFTVAANIAGVIVVTLLLSA